MAIVRKNMRKALSLLEVLVFMFVAGLLTVVLYTTLNQVWGNNQTDVTENDLRDFANSFSNYHMDYGKIIIQADSNYQTTLENTIEILNRQYLSSAVEIESIPADKKSCALRTKTKKDPWGE